MVRGVCEGDRRVTRCDIIRIMNWDQLIKYLGEVWEEMWDADAIQAEDRRGKHTISIIIPHIFYPHFYLPFSEVSQGNEGKRS
jgi:hypothetical protein